MASDINHMLELVEAGTIATLTHIDRKDNPHEVTKEQVGLGNADNTSDLDKPVSNATASAITTLRTETHSMINQVNENVGTIVGELNNNIGVITGEINKQILGTQSAVATLREETFSAIGTFKEENKKAHDKITQTTNSMINQLNENIVTVVEGINNNIGVITGEINKQILGTQSAVATLRDENEDNHRTIVSAINTFKTATNASIEELKETKQNALIMYDDDLDTLLEEGDYSVAENRCPHFDSPTGSFAGYRRYVQVRALIGNDGAKVFMQAIYNEQYKATGITCNPTAVRTYNTANKAWGEWNTNLPMLDLSFTTMAGWKKANYEATDTVLVADQSGGNIKHMPVNTLKSGDHNHDTLYLKPATADTKYAPKTHNHDTLYLKPATADTKYAPKTHNHDTLYLKPATADTKYAPKTHNHDDVYSRYYHTHNSIIPDNNATVDSTVGHCSNRLVFADYSYKGTDYSLPGGEYAVLTFTANSSTSRAQLAISLHDGSLRTRVIHDKSSTHGPWQVK